MNLHVSQPVQTYSEVGRVRLNAEEPSSRATWRHAKLTLSREAITLTVLGDKRYRLERSQIVQIHCYYDLGLFAQGIVISHCKPEYPSSFVFWTFSFAQLRAGLEQWSYEFSR